MLIAAQLRESEAVNHTATQDCVRISATDDFIPKQMISYPNKTSEKVYTPKAKLP